jgi:hypothetical protein
MTPAQSKKRSRGPIPFPAGASIFRRMFARLGCHGRPPQFLVAFHPYASLSHNIRLRGEEADARLSDLMRDAPLEALEAAAAILLAKLYRLRLPAALALRYRQFAESECISRRLDRARRHRGRRKHAGAQGSAHNLERIFQRLNGEYFSGRLPAIDVGWSMHTWRRQLGVFDPGMSHIVINRRLDRRSVPEDVVAYVVFHEMLHLERSAPRPREAESGAESAAGERCRMGLHTSEFRRAERRYREFARARSFLLRAGLW